MVDSFSGSQTFPSRYGALPAISYDNPTVRNDAFRSTNFNTDGESAGERLRQLEVRVHIAERSNQALLEELVRTQNELRSNRNYAFVSLTVIN